MEKDNIKIFTVMLKLIGHAEPILEQMGNQEALTKANELRSLIITYLYLKKQSEENPDITIQLQSIAQAVEILPLIEFKTIEFNDILSNIQEA